MFEHGWSEGHDLSREHPKEIPLEKDDTEAMKTVCCAIHHRNDMLPTTIPPEDVLEIAIVSDKYDFASAPQYATAQWLQACGGQSMLDAGILMTSALLFGDADAFARLTFTIIDKLELARSAAVELGHGSVAAAA